MSSRILLAIASLAFSCLAAHAETLTFNFVMDPGPGGYSGTGSFTVTTTAGQTVYTPGNGLSLITGSFDGIPISDSLNLAYSFSPESVTIVDGQVTSLFADLDPSSSVNNGPGYYFGYLEIDGTTFQAGGEALEPTPTDPNHYNHYFTEGGEMAYTSVASTPEPSSFVLLGSALFGATGLIRRRLIG